LATVLHNVTTRVGIYTYQLRKGYIYFATFAVRIVYNLMARLLHQYCSKNVSGYRHHLLFCCCLFSRSCTLSSTDTVVFPNDCWVAADCC